ncbi:hypothetical protein GN244_ATG05466 [Phytophthora infestans]|uniref:Uncharacterized protein n=1 Tax=Phytophthora infestans TaxID=4787 RepID=A0A833TJX7_PHYIN|nr:hypothetical protein GN244_ATG05466 [Phytophthora infestans]KAF4137839.1 hypothetical protein GN958_ATG12792 [Phytophthora infestans]
MASRPQDKSKIKEIKKTGFVHATLNLMKLMLKMLKRALESPGRAPAPEQSDSSSDEDDDKLESDSKTETPTTESSRKASPKPPGHEQRAAKIKRIRGGRGKS